MRRLFKKSFFFLLFVSVIATASAKRPDHWTQDSVFIIPDTGRTSWLEAIKNAEKSIDMAAYKISDDKIIEALEDAHHKRKVEINIIIEPFQFEHAGSGNVQSPLDKLRTFATVHKLSDRFNQAHSKMIVVDKEWGLISTGNLDAESFDGIPEKAITAARDFAVPILDPSQIEEMLKVFDADCQDKRFIPTEKTLIVGPDYQRSTFLNLLNSAEHSIEVYQQSYQDEGLTKATAGAAKAGVKVRVLMMPFPFGKNKDANIPNQNYMKKAGVDIGLLEKLYVHAKVIIVDNKSMYIGSGNFYTPAIDQTRELGVLITNLQQIKQVKDQFEHDWQQSKINMDRHEDDKME